jgi:hypothetical protein
MFSLNGQFTALLSRYIPLPAALAASGVTLGQYYQQLSFFLGTDRTQNPMKYADIAAALASFDPGALTAELQSKIATPTLDAGALFTSFPYLTRLYTTLSPEDMNKDPVFSYNASLPDYSNLHNATLTYHCSGFFASSKYSDATLQTANAFQQQYSVADADSGNFTPLSAPYSQQIQILHDTGAAELVVDNTTTIRSALGQGGCTISPAGSQRSGGAFALAIVGEPWPSAPCGGSGGVWPTSSATVLGWLPANRNPPTLTWLPGWRLASLGGPPPPWSSAAT